MHSRNYSNSIQTPISSIFPQLRSLPFFLPLPHIPNFYYPYQSFHFRPFFLPRLLMPSINLFMPPLIRIHSSTPGNEKKLLSNLSIDSIIGSSVDENKTKRESKDIEDVISSIFTGPSHPSLSDYLPLQMLLYSYHLALKNSDNNKVIIIFSITFYLKKGNALIKDDISANTNIKTEKVLKDLSKVMLVQSKKGKKPRASFEPTNEENAQIQASEASSSNFIDKSRGYACHRCGKLFSYAYYLDKHLKFTPCVDNGQRRFPCPHLHCLRSFEKRESFNIHNLNLESRLRIHILHVHERRRPHICQLCGKAFSQSSSLSKHMRTHSGERPYKCPHCDKSFTASSILRTHIRQHSGEKPFKCTICGKQFASHAAHDSHMRRSHQK